MTQIFKETDYDLQKGESRTRDDSDIRNEGTGSFGLSNFNHHDAYDFLAP